MERFNLLRGELEHEFERGGSHWHTTRVADHVNAEKIGASLYELGEGERTFPYHFHHGVEEWLLVVAGSPIARTPAGERELRVGDVVCCPSGPGGAHSIRGPGRVLILSHGGPPSVSVYPDSDKLGTRPEELGDRLNFRRGDAVDYWEGE
jgi:uncharacterized cupin superfamily protein